MTLSITYLAECRNRFLNNSGALFGLFLLFFLFIGSLLGPLIAPYPYYETHLELKNLPPSTLFWFGTDELGRDIFCRVWIGMRISLAVGFIAGFIDMIIGVAYGSIAGFFGGWIDEILMRIVDILYAIPHLLIAILLSVIFELGPVSLTLILTITGWINMARVVRGQIVEIKKSEFVLAAKALGASSFHILRRHVILNALGSILITLAFTIPTVIFHEAYLSFLGLGIQSPLSSLGMMLNDGMPALYFYPWRLFFPALFISLTIASLHLIARGMRKAFDRGSV